MTRRTYGLLAGAIGSALGAWLLRRRFGSHTRRGLTPAREKGNVIFDNTPTASGEGIV